MAEQAGCDLAELSLEQMQSVHADINEDVYNVLSVEASVASRMSMGAQRLRKYWCKSTLA